MYTKRLKIDLEGLVNEILDHLPKSVFKSNTTTFLDPAMGSGQFIKEVIARLKVHGHSDANIRQRIFGCEATDLRVNYAINKNNLIGEYMTDAKLDKSKKFDVVITNPPYQNPGKSKGQKLWYKFIFLADSLVKQNGYVVMVTPTSWIRGGVNHGRQGVLKDLFAKKQLLIANFKDITKKHFGRIGIEIGYWIMQNKPNCQSTKLVLQDSVVQKDLTDIEVMSPVADSRAISILEKFIDDKLLKEEVIYYNFKNPNRDLESNEKSKSHPIKHWVHGCSQKGNDTYTFLSSRFNDKLDFQKILFVIGSRYWQPFIDYENVGVLTQGFAIPIKKDWTQEGILSVYESKLWKLINFNFQLLQNGFMKNAIVKKMPAMDLSKVWTDDELYKYFGLDEKEIKYIEDNVE